MLRKLTSLFFAALLSCAFASARTVNTAKLDSLLDVLAAHNKAMGSLAISINGKLVYARAIGYGMINSTAKVPADTSWRYRIGSISKMFTATMIMQLAEQGKLSLDQPVKKYFPKLPNAGTITIAQLLCHHSGLHNFTDDEAYTTWMTQAKTRDEMLAIITKGGSDFAPGSKGEYSNSNYVVLGFVLEKIYGKPYAEILREKITGPLGLQNTYFGGKTDAARHECYSYAYMGEWQQQPETDMSIPHGAGAIVSTPADMVQFIYALFTEKLVSRKTLDQMMQMKDNYGLGMFAFPFGLRKSYGHTGGIDGFGSVLSYFPGDSIAVAYSSNGEAYPMNDILIGALSIVFDEPYTLPVFNEVKLADERLDQYLGEYTSTQLPLGITVSRNGQTLMMRATGQSAFPLEAVSETRFQCRPIGVEVEFKEGLKQFTLTQGGTSYLYERKP